MLAMVELPPPVKEGLVEGTNGLPRAPGSLLGGALLGRRTAQPPDDSRLTPG